MSGMPDAYRRQLHHGHYLLPVHTLGWTPKQWGQAQAAMVSDAQYTRDLCERGGEQVARALGALAEAQAALALDLRLAIPRELRADSVRQLVTALRRAQHHSMASQLVQMFNDKPGEDQAVKSMVFTGTRQGLTPQQLVTLGFQLALAARLYHGCCHGGDTECHNLARGVCDPDLCIEGYPGNDEQAARELTVDLMHPVPRVRHPELARNRHMLTRARDHWQHPALLVACPKGFEEERRSGTWATIRYATKMNIERHIIWPDGRVVAP